MNADDPTTATPDVNILTASAGIPGDSAGIRPAVAPSAIDPVADRVRFRLRDMIIGMTAFSVALALFKSIGIFGALCAFVTAVACTVYLNQARLPIEDRERVSAQRQIFKDFLWGVCMPIVCLAFDPMVFRQMGLQLTDFTWARLQEAINPLGKLVYPALAFQLTLMLVWLSAGWSLRRVGGFFAGAFFVGAVTALAIGLMLMPISIIGLAAAGIGAMGLTPWFTGLAYFRRMRRANVLGQKFQTHVAYRVSLAAGFLCAFVIPLITTALLFGEDAVTGWWR